MLFSLLAVLLCAGIAAYFVGRQRALSLVTFQRDLHSLPNAYGFWQSIVTIGAPLLILLGWAIFTPSLFRWWVFKKIGTPVEDLTQPQRDAAWRDIEALSSGGTANFSDPIREQGAQLYTHLYDIAHTALAFLILVLAIGGFVYGWQKIIPAFRARHKVEAIVKFFLFASSAIAILTTFGIVLSLIGESLRFFSFVSPMDFLFGTSWTPQQMAFRADQVGGNAAFGIIPLITGTLLITAIAIGVAAPLGLFSAIYLSDYASPRLRTYGKPALEMLAGIPTVVYGFFAALTVAPLIRDAGQAVGLGVSSESALAAGLVMGIMIVPFVSSLSDDIINAVPQSLRDGSMAIGATKSETIRKVVIPAALPGIVSALLLAISRAIGETMIVLMAAGLAANLTLNPLEAVTTFTVQIGTLLTGDQEFDSPKTLAAFALGLVLFTITLALNLIALKVVKRYREQYE
ncbi:MAG: phosphate ABC transporter permease subunit PstC [Pseudomonadota bacterium]